MFAPFARWFFFLHRSHVSRIFARSSHNLLFQVFFVRTDFRTFRAFSHDFRRNCFFQVFCSHVSRVFARSSHAGRWPAYLCQIRSKQIWKITRFDWRTPNFWMFAKKTLTNWNEHIGMFWLFVQLILCKNRRFSKHFDDFLKNLLANLNWTLQNFPKKQQRVFQIEMFTYFVLNWSLSNDPDGFDMRTDGPVQIKGFRAFRNNNRQHAFQITIFKYFCLSCSFHAIWHCGFSCFKRLTLISGFYVQRACDGGCTTRFEFPCSSEARKENIQRRRNCCDPFWSDI